MTTATSDDYRFEVAKRTDFDLVIAFLMKHFRHEEPISRSVGLTDEDAATVFPGIVRSSLRYPVSFLVYATSGDLAAVRLSTIYTRGEKTDDHGDGSDDLPLTPRAKLITDFLDKVESDMWSLLPSSAAQVLKCHVLSVRPDYYRRGIARRSIEMSIVRAKELGLAGCIATATAYNSQQLFTKLQFTVLKEVLHSDYKDEIGNQIFRCDDATNKGVLMYCPA